MVSILVEVKVKYSGIFHLLSILRKLQCVTNRDVFQIPSFGTVQFFDSSSFRGRWLLQDVILKYSECLNKSVLQ